MFIYKIFKCIIYTILLVIVLLDLTDAAEKIKINGNVLIETGLVFEKEFDYKIPNTSCTDIIQLKGLSAQVQSIQFRIAVNKSVDDSTILIFDGLQKGTSLIDTAWVLTYNIFRGTILSNGASEDSVYVLLYNTSLNGSLAPGDHNDLIKVNYRVSDMPDEHDSLKSSIRISFPEASSPSGQNVDIIPSRDEFKVLIRRTIPLPRQGLIFESDTLYRMDDDSYTDIIQLKSLSDKMQAFQFRLLMNKAADDDTLLTFVRMEKGSGLNDPSWVLNYNVFRGPLTPNGGSVDSIYVLVYNLGQNNGLMPGDYDSLLKVTYRVADLPPLQDSLKSSLIISQALGSTYQGFPIDITPSRNELTIIVRNSTSAYGDVNGDGCLDILDILLIVDHIIGRDSLDAEEFERADIAPWVISAPDPNPDGKVNVLDLAVLQNIILTGFYPSGEPVNGCLYTINKITGTSETAAKFYINNNGIAVYLNSGVEIRGVQLEFGNVKADPGSISINTELGKGYYNYSDNTLRVLLYDRSGKKVFSTDDDLLADLLCSITNPSEITLEKIILIDKDRQPIQDIESEIIINSPASLPSDFILEQNYPNPFNPSTAIEFSIPVKSRVILTIHDMLGGLISVPVNEDKNSGVYRVDFVPENLSSGVYFYTLQTVTETGKNFVQTKKMMFMK